MRLLTRLEIGPGLVHFPHLLDRPAQRALAEEIGELRERAPLFQPRMPRTGKPFSVLMTNFGPLGWVSDQSGYRYQPTHPVTSQPWPPMPALVLSLWEDLSGYPLPPEACLLNVYRAEARMGLHQDRDEHDFAAPVLSISLGDTAVFRIGGQSRRDPTRSIRLESGDVFLLGGPARLAFHGIDRILPGSSTLLPSGGRINLTLRRVSRPANEA